MFTQYIVLYKSVCFGIFTEMHINPLKDILMPKFDSFLNYFNPYYIFNVQKHFLPVITCLHIVKWYLVFIYPTSSLRRGYDARSIFKSTKACLNSGFPLFWIGCITKDKELNLSYYLPIDRRKNKWIHAFPKDISIKFPPTPKECPRH